MIWGRSTIWWLSSPGARLTGEALPLLLDLVDGGIIRILDIVFIRKDRTDPLSCLRSRTSTGTAVSTTKSCSVPHQVCSAATTSSRRPPWSNRAARPPNLSAPDPSVAHRGKDRTPEQAEPSQPVPSSMDDRLAQLQQLGTLKAQGVLSDAEFEQQKSRILNS
jgi:Short C-terminal domain